MNPVPVVKPKPNQCPKPTPVSPIVPIFPVVVSEVPTVENDGFGWAIGVGIAAGVVVLLLIGIVSYVSLKLKKVPQVTELPIDFDPNATQVNQSKNYETQMKIQDQSDSLPRF